MSKVALIIDEPKTCSECPFISSPIYMKGYLVDEILS